MAALRRTPEEQLRREAEKRAKAEAKAAAKDRAFFEKTWNAFWASPAGEARKAFANGDHVFQYTIDVMSQRAIIVAMVGSSTSKNNADPSAVLNAVCHEGWELVNGSFTFVQTGQQSRDKFMSSGQNVAIAGTVMGYYLFKRCPENRKAETEEQLRRRLMGIEDDVEDAESGTTVCPECGASFPDLIAYTTHYREAHQD